MEHFLEERPIYPHHSLGVQAFTSDEWIFMSGASYQHFGIRAIPISVYNYELTMLGIAQSLNHDTKPFLTYLREDDTYEILAQRIMLYTGECDWEHLALVSRAVRPYILPVESPSQSDEANNNNSDDDEKGEIWYYSYSHMVYTT